MLIFTGYCRTDCLGEQIAVHCFCHFDNSCAAADYPKINREASLPLKLVNSSALKNYSESSSPNIFNKCDLPAGFKVLLQHPPGGDPPYTPLDQIKLGFTGQNTTSFDKSILLTLQTFETRKHKFLSLI